FSIKLTTLAESTELKLLSMSVNVVAVAGDALITVFLCAFLQKSRTGVRRSDTVLNKLILWSIRTGLLASVCAVISLISVYVVHITAWPDTSIYMALYFCLGRREYNLAKIILCCSHAR
ncbi:hypothetical protein DFH29DRAFT_793063, partial [Suillus ampliporus]